MLGAKESNATALSTPTWQDDVEESRPRLLVWAIMTATPDGHHIDPKSVLKINERHSIGCRLNDRRKRDALLGGVAEAARRLLAIADFDAAVNGALEAIATAAGIDRIFVYQHHVDVQTQREFADCSYEWTVPGIVRSCDLPGQFPMFYDEILGYVDWLDELKAGRAVQRLATEMSAEGQQKQIQEKALSVLTVPVFVEGEYWGNFGFDDCTTERVWSEAEIAVLETAAASFAGALQRRRDMAELEQRDALLHSVNAAAQCLVAGEDLEWAIPKALRILGEGTQQDRVYVFENVFPKAPDEVFWEVTYEWVKQGVPASTEIVTSEWPLPMASFPSELMNPFLEGQTVQFLTRNLEGSARTINEEGLTLSLVAVPISLSGQWWGVLGFDDCTSERMWSDAAIAVLQTAAACIGSAIERDRTRKEREASARVRAAELESHNRVLERRDRILQVTATASNVLLNGEDFDASVSEALAILGESLGFDRIGVGQQFDDPTGESSGFVRFLYEWDGPGIRAQLQDYEDMADFHWDQMGLGSWYQANLRGEAFSQFLEELPDPFRTLMQAVDVKSTHNIPIFVEGQFWGVFGIDHCHEKRLLTAVELVALKTAANCVGGAIARDRTRKERETAARTRAAELEAHNQALAERDRILEATAAAANVMLTDEDFDSAVNSSLQIIGIGLGLDRVGLMKKFGSTDNTLGYHQQLFEWTGLGLPSQLDHPELVRISECGIEYLGEQLARGEIFGGVVVELPEPFRSGQQELGVQSTYAVPVMVDGSYWGLIGLDDCHRQTRRSEAELEALRTLANCIGSAIEREQLRQAELQAQTAREAAERNILLERERAAQERAAQLQSSNEILSLRDRWLDATAAAAEQLLSGDDLESAIAPALQTIGESIGVDRIGIMQTSERDGQKIYKILSEWTSPGQPIQSEHSELKEISAAVIGNDLIELVESGSWVGGDIDDDMYSDDFRKGQKRIGVQSTYAVPILIDGSCWGIVGIDHCREKKLLTETEMAVFQTIASCFASAIQRDQIRQAREAAERTALIERERAARAAELEAANAVLITRERWLETTAAAANQLLSSNDMASSVNEALATIGENLECDRITVMEYIRDPNASPDDLGLMRVLYEWDTEGISSQFYDPELRDISADGIEDWFQQFLNGQYVGGVVAELEEPFRSGQQKLGVQSTYGVPVFVEGKLWGIVAMDHCHEARRLSAAELAVFRTAATCVGSAIYQARVRRDRAARERARLLSSVAEAANLLLRSENYTTVLPEVTRLLGEAVECDRCSIGQDVPHPKSDRSAVKIRADWEWCSTATLASGEFSPNGDGLFHWDDAPYIAAKLRNGDVANVLVPNLPEPDRTIMSAQGNFAELYVPITVNQRLWGFIAFDNCWESRLYDEAEISILRVAAESIASAISRQAQDEALRDAEKAVLEEKEKAARVRAAELAKTNHAIRQTLDALTATPELEGFLGTILTQIVEQIHAACAYLFLYDGSTHTLQTHIAVRGGEVYKHNAPDDPEILRHPIPADITPFWQVLTNSTVPFTLDENHPQAAELFWPTTVEWHESLGHKSSTCICLKLGKKPIGFVGFAFTQYTALTHEQLEFIQALANQATLAIHLTRLAEDAKQTAILQEQEKAAQERAAELAKANEAIGATLNALTTTPEVNEFLSQILTKINEQVGARDAHLFLYDEATDDLRSHIVVQDGQIYQGTAPNDPEVFRQCNPMAGYAEAWQAIINSTKPVTLDENNPKTAQLWPQESINWHQAEGHRSATVACMKVGRKPVGFIGFAFRHIAALSDEQLEFIQALTNQATLSIHLTRLAEEAKQTAILQEQEKAAQERAAELAKTNEAIGNTLANLATNPELDHFLSILVQELSEIVGAANTGLFLYNAEDNTLYRYIHVQDGKASLGSAPRDAEMLKRPFPADITDIWQLILDSPQPITFADTGAPEDNPSDLWWKDTIDWHISEGHRELACARLKVGDIPLGFIGFCFREHRTFSAEQLEFIQALANQATLAIHLTQLAEDAKQTAILQEQEKAAQERATKLAQTNEAIAHTLTSLTETPELDEFLGQILSKLSESVEACKAHLFLYDEPSHTLHQHITVQEGLAYQGAAPNDPDLFRHPIPADLSGGWQIITGSEKPFTLDERNPHAAEFFWPETVSWHQEQGHLSATCACMRVGHKPIGFIGFAFRHLAALTDEQLEFIQALTNQATLSIQLTRLADQVKQSAILQEREKAAQERAAELAQTNDAIARTLDALTTTPELNEFLGQILTQIVEQIEADDTHLFIYDSETHTLRSQLAVQNSTVYLGTAPGDPDIFSTDIPADITAGWQILVDESKPITLDDNNPRAAEFYWPTTAEWHSSRGHQSATCICMKIGERPIGFIGFAFCNRRVLTSGQLEFIQALTNQATLSIHLTRLAEQARTNALTEERARLAREIHDTLAQAFTGVSLQLEAVRGITAAKNGSFPSPQDFAEAQTYIRRARDLARAGLSEARRSVRALRSEALETDVLPDALRKALAQTQRDTGLDTHFYLEGNPAPLAENLELNLLRISQEAITNTLRHARATQLDLTLRFWSDRIQLCIVDDGQGFDPAQLSTQGGFGLLGIRERTTRFYGTFDLISTPDIGTIIEVTIPLNTT